MSIKKTHDEYIKELSIKNPNTEVVEKYIDAKTLIKHHCKIHNVFWDMSPSNALKGKCCKQCKSEKIRNALRKNNQEYIKDLALNNSNIEAIGDYINSNTPILHRCKIHNYEWMARPYNVLEGKGCLYCRSEKIKQKHTWTHEQYTEQLMAKNGNIEVIEKYINMNTYILHRCKIHKCEWKMTPNAILNAGCGCPECNTSNGEKAIRQWLEENNIQYIQQYIFNECKDERYLRFDFYIPKYNLCIEYDGEQHFMPVDFAGRGKQWAENQMLKTQKHDSIKTTYCQLNNIRLLRISYLQDIKDELNNFFSFEYSNIYG